MLQIFYKDAVVCIIFPIIKIANDPIHDIDIRSFNHVRKVFEFRAIQRAGFSGKGFLISLKEARGFFHVNASIIGPFPNRTKISDSKGNIKTTDIHL